MTAPVRPPAVGDRKVFTHVRTGGTWTWTIMAVTGCVLTVRSDAGPGTTWHVATDQWATGTVTPGLQVILSAMYDHDPLGPPAPAPPPPPPPAAPAPALPTLSDADLRAIIADEGETPRRRLAARKVLDSRGGAR